MREAKLHQSTEKLLQAVGFLTKYFSKYFFMSWLSGARAREGCFCFVLQGIRGFSVSDGYGIVILVSGLSGEPESKIYDTRGSKWLALEITECLWEWINSPGKPTDFKSGL